MSLGDDEEHCQAWRGAVSTECLGVSGSPLPLPCQGQSEAQEMRPVFSVRRSVSGGWPAALEAGHGARSSQDSAPVSTVGRTAGMHCQLRDRRPRLPNESMHGPETQFTYQGTLGHRHPRALNTSLTHCDSQANTAAHTSSPGPSAAPSLSQVTFLY